MRENHEDFKMIQRLKKTTIRSVSFPNIYLSLTGQ